MLCIAYCITWKTIFLIGWQGGRGPNIIEPNGIDGFVDTEARELVAIARATTPALDAAVPATMATALDATLDEVPTPEVTNMSSIMGTMSICGP